MQQQLVALADLLAVQLVVLGGGPAHVEDRRHPADELLDRGRRAAAPGARAGSGAGRGCRASSRIIVPITVRVVSAPPLSTRIVSSRTCSVSQPSVWPTREIRSSRGSARRCSMSSHRDLDELRDHRPEPGMRCVRRAVGRGLAGEQHDLLGPVADPLPQLARVAEQVADHDRGQARRDGLDRLALTERHDVVEDRVATSRTCSSWLRTPCGVNRRTTRFRCALVRRDRPC